LDAVPNNATDDSRTSALWNKNDMLDSEQLYFLRFRFLNYQIKYCYESHCEHQMKTHLSAKSVEVDQYFMLKLLICVKLMQLNNNINKKR